MDTSEWLKSVLVVGHEDGGAMDYSSTSGGLMASSSRLPAIAETRLRTPTPQNEQAALKCPRCESTRTKFCYYNNYSLSQPRYFCKTCRRYWTKGGSLRNVPVGGGCRKNSKRPHPVVKKADEPLGRAPAIVMGSGATDLQRHRPSFAAPIGLDTEDTTSMMQRSTRSLYFMGNDGIIGFQAASRLGITSATNTLGLVVFPMEECRDEKAAAEVKHGEGNPSFGWRDPSCSPNVVRDQHGEGNPSFGWRDPSCSPNVVRDQPMGCSDGHRRADKFFY